MNGTPEGRIPTGVKESSHHRLVPVALALACTLVAASARPAPNPELSRRARHAVSVIDGAGARAARALREARMYQRGSVDICVSRTLNQVHAHARLAEERMQKLQAHLRAGDDRSARSELIVLERYANQAARLARESERCSATPRPAQVTVLSVVRPNLPLEVDTSLASLFRP